MVFGHPLFEGPACLSNAYTFGHLEHEILYMIADLCSVSVLSFGCIYQCVADGEVGSKDNLDPMSRRLRIL